MNVSGLVVVRARALMWPGECCLCVSLNSFATHASSGGTYPGAVNNVKTTILEVVKSGEARNVQVELLFFEFAHPPVDKTLVFEGIVSCLACGRKVILYKSRANNNVTRRRELGRIADMVPVRMAVGRCA
jgi:hypothetical protein